MGNVIFSPELLLLIEHVPTYNYLGIPRCRPYIHKHFETKCNIGMYLYLCIYVYEDIIL